MRAVYFHLQGSTELNHAVLAQLKGALNGWKVERYRGWRRDEGGDIRGGGIRGGDKGGQLGGGGEELNHSCGSCAARKDTAYEGGGGKGEGELQGVAER